ncbi:hypothetical protein B0H19DRAFT_1302338 [Mycena capillaripes]|nr:hypothetical protein B0H19DRAFT_1302338 [Mycena capillaripes]
MMLPNYNHNHNPNNSSSFPITTPPPGHKRNRIACGNCRKRKVKCTTTKKQPHAPCERCVKENVTCEYVAISDDERSISSPAPPVPRWVQPLSPESYAQSKDIFPRPPQPQAPNMYTGYGAQAAGPPGQMAPFPQPAQSQYSGADLYSNGPSIPGNRFPTATAPPYPAPPYPASHIHYGQFPGPANTVYPWTVPQQASAFANL